MTPTRTEQRNPRTRGLDTKSTIEILRVLNQEDQRVALAVRRVLPQIARAVDAIVASFRRGGRLVYLGAGTSGRLAVLDAAECPPTFGTRPKMVQALIAGGAKALRGAVEGAEDSATNGARDLAKTRVTKRDVVVGIAASGTTRYVLGGMEWAKTARVRDCGGDIESQIAAGAHGTNCHHAGNRPGGDCRVHTDESWNRAENGAEHAFYHCDGAARQSL